MRLFNQLSERGQRARLRQTAQRALAAYRLPSPRMRFVSHAENTVFRVDADQAAAPAPARPFVPGRYLLRVHGDSYNTRPQIESELAWLRSLRADMDLAVPEPVELDGGFVQTVELAGAPTPRHCSLLRWMRGSLRRRSPGHDDIAKVGRLAALLHEHAQGWRPAGFDRRRWDLAGITGIRPDGAAGDERYAWDVVPAAQRALFQTIGGVFKQALDELGEGPAVFGLIHADLHFSNVLFADGEARAIDFDDCGYGYWLYDPATVLSRWLLTEHWDGALAAFLTGYQAVRPFPADQLGYLGTFVAGRHLGYILWALGKSVHDPSFRKWIDEDVAQAERFFARFLKR